VQSQFGLAGARQSAIDRIGHGTLPSANIPPAAVAPKQEQE